MGRPDVPHTHPGVFPALAFETQAGDEGNLLRGELIIRERELAIKRKGG